MDIATSIRGARVSDHAQSQALFEELDRLHRDGAPWLVKKPDRDPRPLEWLQTLLANHNSALFVADVGACVGLATVPLRDAPSFEMFIQQRHAVIDDLVVHPDWCRRGIAPQTLPGLGRMGTRTQGVMGRGRRVQLQR
jgi:hypothetical protein